jgi:heavy metal efflux system protein
MIERIVSFCLHRRWLVLALLLCLSLYGVYAWTQLAVEAYPDIADVTSQVITTYPGHAAEEVEQQITIPLERELSGIPGLQVMRSKSTFGLSLIVLVFRDGVESYWSRQRIQERISGVTLPEGASTGLDPLTSPTGEFYRYTLESKIRGPRALKELQEWVVKPKLKQVFGVADVTSFGGETSQFEVLLDPSKLMQYDLTLRQVIEAVETNNTNAGGSVLVHGQQGFVVRGLGSIKSPEELALIVVAEKDGVPILLRELGRVEMGVIERVGILGKDGNDDAVQGIVVLLKGENPSRVLDDLHVAVGELNDKILPDDVEVVPYLDRTWLVNDTIKTVARTLLEGMALVTVVLILFLGSLRGALLVALTIPFSLLFAFVLMHLTDIPANLLSLGAIDFGIIVDSAIVLMEVVLRRREEHAGATLTQEAARAAALEVARPKFFATLIIIAAYLPLFAFERVEGKLFTPMAFTIGYALLGGLLFALVAVPALAYLTYRKPGRVWRNPAFEWLQTRYDGLLRTVIARPQRALAGGLAAAALAILLGATVGREFLPYLDEGSIWIQVQMPPGISLPKAIEISREFRKAVREFPETSYVVTQLGRNDDGTDPWTPSHIECSVGLKPYDQWGGDKQALIRRMDARLKQIPGISVGFSQPMIDGVNDKIAGAHSDLVVKIHGDDFAETRRIAEQVAAVVAAVPGAVDVAIDQEPPLPQLQIAVDRLAAARFGINVADVAELIEAGIGGKAVSQVFLGDRVYDVSVRYHPDARHTPEQIGDLTLLSASGARIPLAQIATLRLASGESTITREMNRRHLTVKLNLRDRDLASFLTEAQRTIAEQVKFDPAHYEIRWGGQFENQRRAQARLAVVIPVGLGVIFLLLYAGFGVARYASIVLITVPLALVGGFAALHLRGMTLNVSSAVGFIALFGVAVQYGVIMIANINRWRATELDLEEAIRRGAGERLRPVLMTALVATLGLLPAALTFSIGSDVQRPLATVIVGGLISATALTLFVLPAAYYVMERRVLARSRAPDAAIENARPVETLAPGTSE